MSVKVVFNGEELIIPGAYSKFEIAEKGDAPLSSAGIVGIVGEAEGGEPHVLDVITKSQFESAIKRYQGGRIADAIGLLKAPSKDSRIPGGASKIVIYKVNNSLKAELDLNVIKVLDKNWGDSGNSISALISNGAIEDSQAALEGTVVGPYSVASGDTLVLNAAGSVYTYTAPAATTPTVEEMVVALNVAGSWVPSLPINAEVEGDKVKITILDSIGTFDSSYVVVDPASTLDTILGITGEDRGSKGSRIVTIKKGDLKEESKDVGGVPSISVQYVGTGAYCKLTIAKVSDKLNLKTDTGVVAEDLAIDLEDAEGKPLSNLSELVAFINSKDEYVAEVLDIGAGVKSSTQLDFYTEIGCKDMKVSLARDMFLLLDNMNAKSELIEIERKEIAGALETFAAYKFLSGGSRGSSTTSDYLAAFASLNETRVNVAVPLLSEDESGVSVDSVNGMAETYAREGWTSTGASERQVYVSKQCSKEDLKTAAMTLQSEYCSILGQDIRQRDAITGEYKWMQPWAHACIYAGMQVGGDAGEPTTLKRPNVNDVRVKDGSWNPLTDAAEMVDAGVSVTKGVDTGGYEIVVANTTYGVDGNFFKNRTNVIEAAATLLYDLRNSLKIRFAGTKASTGGAIEVKNFVKARSEVYLADELIVGNESNDFLGYRDLQVIEDGSITRVLGIYTIVEGRDFILPEITFERNKSVA